MWWYTSATVPPSWSRSAIGIGVKAGGVGGHRQQGPQAQGHGVEQMMHGIDVSDYQTVSDWSQVRAHAEFCYVQVGYGTAKGVAEPPGAGSRRMVSEEVAKLLPDRVRP